MERVPIMVDRTPILTAGEKCQTIASHNQNYDPCEIMGTYPDLETARQHYQEDMDEVRRSGKGYKHFAIRKVTCKTGGTQS